MIFDLNANLMCKHSSRDFVVTACCANKVGMNVATLHNYDIETGFYYLNSRY